MDLNPSASSGSSRSKIRCDADTIRSTCSKGRRGGLIAAGRLALAVGEGQQATFAHGLESLRQFRIEPVEDPLRRRYHPVDLLEGPQGWPDSRRAPCPCGWRGPAGDVRAWT